MHSIILQNKKATIGHIKLINNGSPILFKFFTGGFTFVLAAATFFSSVEI
jgi:hypothetical protein